MKPMPPNAGRFASEEAALAALVRRLADRLQPEQIWLFGSRARGDHRRESDFDLLVITRDPVDPDRAYAPVRGSGVGCDVIPVTVAEWEDSIRDAGGVLRAVREEGKLVYGKP